MKHLHTYFHDNIDFIQVAIAHGIAAIITFTNVNDALKTLGLLTALGFGLYKWYRFKKTQDKIDQNIKDGQSNP